MAKTVTLKKAAKNAAETSGTAASEKTAKNKSTKSENLKAATAEAVASKALTEVKYNYPDDVNTPAKRKTFRAETRRKIKSLLKRMDEAANSTDASTKAKLKELKAEYNNIAGNVRRDLEKIK